MSPYFEFGAVGLKLVDGASNATKRCWLYPSEVIGKI